MGKFSTFYLLNFDTVLNSHQVDDDINDFNNLFDKGLIEEKTPRKEIANFVLNYSKVLETKSSKSIGYLEYSKN
jgi:hypothetical protein